MAELAWTGAYPLLAQANSDPVPFFSIVFIVECGVYEKIRTIFDIYCSNVVGHRCPLSNSPYPRTLEQLHSIGRTFYRCTFYSPYSIFKFFRIKKTYI